HHRGAAGRTVAATKTAVTHARGEATGVLVTAAGAGVAVVAAAAQGLGRACGQATAEQAQQQGNSAGEGQAEAHGHASFSGMCRRPGGGWRRGGGLLDVGPAAPALPLPEREVAGRAKARVLAVSKMLNGPIMGPLSATRRTIHPLKGITS